MICSACRKRIDTQNEKFEEVGSIEFAHSRCVEEDELRVDDADDYKKREESPEVSQGIT